MSDQTAIQWTDATWNPVTGCARVSEGCRNCYAERLTATRLAHKPKYSGLAVLKNGEAHWTGKVRLHEDELNKPLRWRKPRRVFVCSMSDLFHPDVPFAFIDRVFVTMALTSQHSYQLLTKRPERMAEYLRGYRWPLRNVWLGTSVEDQATADERIPHLLRCPAAVRFLSCEPLLGQVDLRLDRLDWVIVGGESGSGARPMDLAWARSIVEQCKAAGVAVFVKQLGSNRIARFYNGIKSKKGGDPSEWPAELRVRELPATETLT